MKASVFLTIMIVVLGLANLPVIIISFEPMKSAISQFIFVIVDDAFIKVEISLETLIRLSPAALSVIGFFVAYCIYKSQDCNWSARGDLDRKYIPIIHDDTKD